MSTTELKLTDQDRRVVNFLTAHNNSEVYWEELAQFSKDPRNVKLKTIQKTVSELRRKYTQAGITVPFNVTFKTLVAPKTEALIVPEPTAVVAMATPPVQNLVKIKRTPDGNTIKMNGSNQHPAQVDYALDFNSRRVKTKYGSHQLNDNEWDIMKYMHSNVDRVVTISELRDKVMFPLAGSKLPARWFDAIMRVINNLRRQIPNLNKRLLTVKGEETSYIFR
jgi:hypothetical protein